MPLSPMLMAQCVHLYRIVVNAEISVATQASLERLVLRIIIAITASNLLFHDNSKLWCTWKTKLVKRSVHGYMD